MDKSAILTSKLKEMFCLHLSRAKFICQCVFALIVKRTVNLSILATCFCDKVSKVSAYRRIQKFFSEVTLNEDKLALFLSCLHPEEKHVLVLDRTNWKFGCSNINFLVLSITYKGIAIPLFWQLLDKRGNSNYEERGQLLRQYIRVFGKERIAYLLADREFIGHEWLSYLLKEDIGFYIRVRNDSLGSDFGIEFPLSWFLSGYGMRTMMDIQIQGCKLNVAGKKLHTGELLIVITNRNPVQALNYYRRRWEIEMFFSCMKQRGFRLEDTHMTDYAKLKTLLALLAICFCWCMLAGEIHDRQRPVSVKSHGRKQNNLFRVGLDNLDILLSNYQTRKQQLDEMIQNWATLFNSVIT